MLVLSLAPIEPMEAAAGRKLLLLYVIHSNLCSHPFSPYLN